MIPPSSVELTRVHFYDPSRKDRNVEVPTVSREVFRHELNKNTIIKRNIFGHKWVLRINEDQDDEKQKCTGRIIVYIWVFCCIIVAICFGIYFSIEAKFFNKKSANTTSEVVPNESLGNTELPSLEYIEKDDNIRKVLVFKLPETQSLEETTEKQNENNFTSPTKDDELFTESKKPFCTECIPAEEICLKTEEFHTPICMKVRDPRDPSGCGGLCELNVQHCRRLHSKMDVFQCIKNKNILRCPPDTFSCGNMCISNKQRCDGVIHCSNMADEHNCDCDMKSNFHCGNSTSCIANAKKCNGIIDCWDKSDETNCIRECNSDEEPCSNGECIKKEHFCDGVFHCSDKSDEPQGC